MVTSVGIFAQICTIAYAWASAILQICVCMIFSQMLGMTDPAIEYLRHVLAAKGWTAADLARAANVSHSTINRPLVTPNWKSAISRSTIEKVHRASGISPATFVGVGPIPVADNSGAATLIAVYNVFASAGAGSLVETEQIVDRLAFPPDYLRHITKTNPKFLQIIGVKGDSMYPTLKDDDIVMIDTSKTDLSYDGMFVFRDGGDALLVKRFNRGTTSETVMLVSDNKSLHPPVERRREDIDVVGKVIWRGVKE